MQSPRKKAIRPQLAIVAVGQIGPSGGKSGNDGNEVTCNDDWSLGSVRIGREDDACEDDVVYRLQSRKRKREERKKIIDSEHYILLFPSDEKSAKISEKSPASTTKKCRDNICYGAQDDNLHSNKVRLKFSDRVTNESKGPIMRSRDKKKDDDFKELEIPYSSVSIPDSQDMEMDESGNAKTKQQRKTTIHKTTPQKQKTQTTHQTTPTRPLHNTTSTRTTPTRSAKTKTPQASPTQKESSSTYSVISIPDSQDDFIFTRSESGDVTFVPDSQEVDSLPDYRQNKRQNGKKEKKGPERKQAEEDTENPTKTGAKNEESEDKFSSLLHRLLGTQDSDDEIDTTEDKSDNNNSNEKNEESRDEKRLKKRNLENEEREEKGDYLKYYLSRISGAGNDGNSGKGGFTLSL